MIVTGAGKLARESAPTGAAAFLGKPVDMDELLDTVGKWCR